jgi:hypothetical protein
MTDFIDLTEYYYGKDGQIATRNPSDPNRDPDPFIVKNPSLKEMTLEVKSNGVILSALVFDKNKMAWSQERQQTDISICIVNLNGRLRFRKQYVYARRRLNVL